ncbi:MAG: hypothetical protein A3F67_05295 [Verrucomicrobia bacterium RIFCSPHIGHO2_12_FULL_41_10]|nr:MAG: hypothetical protein A3F67_05295 [Verrucomicrobia bacterium RIFCSPHIGHO2_12_FULL_41_10]HLB34457.1 hypothetical protein [Chthoniobacterales bacterium]
MQSIQTTTAQPDHLVQGLPPKEGGYEPLSTGSYPKALFFGRSVQSQRYAEGYQKFSAFFKGISSRFSFSKAQIKPSGNVLVPAKSRETLIQQGSLFSPEEFKAVGGISRYWPRDQTYKTLLGGLKSYQREEGNLTRLETRQRLGELGQKAEGYLAQLEKISQNTTTKNEMSQRLEATKLLIHGINFEKKKNDVTIYTSENEKSSEDNFAGGKMSSVSLISYQDGTKGIFKSISYDQKMESTTAASLGIAHQSTIEANLAGRAVATAACDQLLGLGLVPKTDVAFHNGKIGSVQAFAQGETLYQEEDIPIDDQKLRPEIRDSVIDEMMGYEGMVPESFTWKIRPSSTTRLTRSTFASPLYQDDKPVDRQTAGKLIQTGEVQILESKKVISVNKEINFANPSLQKAMANAQILDFLTGQIDRNPGNFIYQKNNEGDWAVQLIDNDLSFPNQFKNFSSKPIIQGEKSTRTVAEKLGEGPALTKLPRLIDQATAEKILNLSHKDLFDLLSSQGLAHSEKNATFERLKVLQNHIQAIQAGKVSKGRLVSSWDNQTYTELLQVEKGANGATIHDNYISRSVEDRDQKAKELLLT